MIKVKRVDVKLYTSFASLPTTDLQLIEDAVNEIGEDKVLHITCAIKHPSDYGCYTIFYHED